MNMDKNKECVKEEEPLLKDEPLPKEERAFKELKDVYPVTWMDSMAPFLKYMLMYGSLFVWTYIGPYVGLNPLYAVPVLSVLMTLKERNKVQRRVRHAIKNFMCNNEEKYLAKIENLPSWVSVFPGDFEKVEWVNTMLLQLWPNITHYVRSVLTDMVEPQVQEYLKSFRFEKIYLGDTPPRVGGIKVYKNTSRKEIVMDMDIMYSGEMSIQVSAVKGFKGGIKEVDFRGTVRVVMTPLIKTIPLIGSIQVYFMKNPELEFNLTNFVDVLDIPGLGSSIRETVLEIVASVMVLPNRITVPMTADIPKFQLLMPQPKGVLRVKLIEARDLEKKDISLIGKGKSDPYAVIRLGAQEFKTPHISNTVNPKWDYCCELEIGQLHQQVELTVMDYDPSGANDSLGSLVLDVYRVAQKGNFNEWLPLADVKSGKIHLELTWLSLSDDIEDLPMQKSAIQKLVSCDGPVRSTAVLMMYVDSAQNLPTRDRGETKPDPKLVISLGSGDNEETAVKYGTENPVWDQAFTIKIQQPESQELTMEVIDNRNGDSLGKATFGLHHLLKEKGLEKMDSTIMLRGENTQSASLVVSMKLAILKNDSYHIKGDDEFGEVEPDEDSINDASDTETKGY